MQNKPLSSFYVKLKETADIKKRHEKEQLRKQLTDKIQSIFGMDIMDEISYVDDNLYILNQFAPDFYFGLFLQGLTLKISKFSEKSYFNCGSDYRIENATDLYYYLSNNGAKL